MGRKQRMRKPHAIALVFENACLEGVGQTNGPRCSKQLTRRLRGRGDEQEAHPRGIRQRCQSALQKLPQRMRNRKLSRRDGTLACLHGSCKLDGEERIPARGLCEPHQRRPAESPRRALEQEPHDRVVGQRLDRDEVNRFDMIEVSRCVGPLRGEEADRGSFSPTERKRNCRRRESIHPMCVVHCNQNRRLAGQGTEQAANGDADRPPVGRQPLRVLEQHRHPQSTPLRLGKGADVVLEAGEEITERSERQSTFSLSRPRNEHAPVAASRRFDACAPEHGLADSRLAFENESGRRQAGALEECLDSGQLLCSANDAGSIDPFPHDFEDGTTEGLREDPPRPDGSYESDCSHGEPVTAALWGSPGSARR